MTVGFIGIRFPAFCREIFISHDPFETGTSKGFDAAKVGESREVANLSQKNADISRIFLNNVTRKGQHTPN